MSKKGIFTIIEYVFLTIVAISIVPVNVYLFSMPKWVTIVICIILSSAYLRMMFAVAKKKKSKAVVSVFFVITLAFTIAGNYFNPYWNSHNFKKKAVVPKDITMDTKLDKKKALADLEEFIGYVKKVHPACMSGLPENVDIKYQNTKNFINNSKTVTIADLYRKIEAICYELRDVNTYVRYESDDIHYLKDMKKIMEENDELVSINGINFSDLIESSKEMYSYEVDRYQDVLLYKDLFTLEGLKYVKVYPNKSEDYPKDSYIYVFKDENGENKEVVYKTSDYLTKEAYELYSKSETEENPFSYEIDDVRKLAIIKFENFENTDEYIEFLNEVFTNIKDKNINNLAVDLRGNESGTDSAIIEFFKYLNVDSWKVETNEVRFGVVDIESEDNVVNNDKIEEKLFEGNVFVLTDTKTFGSAMRFAEYIQDNEIGKIIGETPGNAPTGFGEPVSYVLTNSKLSLMVSTKAFTRANRDNESRMIEPDIKCNKTEVYDKLYDAVEMIKNMPVVQDEVETN